MVTRKSSTTPSEALKGLDPVISVTTQVLVLGSFPGVRSLQAGQYYGHPQNHFWKILAAIWPDGAAVCASGDYPAKLGWMLAHGVGLWDVYAACEREGSLDADIRHAVVNDLASLRGLCPALRVVAHNGAESHRHARYSAVLGVPVVRLPSTSPANASWRFEDKLAAWRRVLAPADAPGPEGWPR